MSMPCFRCGECCRLANCCHLTADNTCDIYATRPWFCRVDVVYDRYYSDVMTRDEFYNLNMEWCSKLYGDL